MKLILFTPAIKSSAIGRMSSLVANQLMADGYDVWVIRTENKSTLSNSNTHHFDCEISSWTDFSIMQPLVESADGLIYQIGDNFSFHEGALEWLQRAPGFVCLHDFYLGNLFNGWAQHRRQEAEAALKIWYGLTIAKEFFSHQQDTFIQKTHLSSPMTEWLCAMAQGVITHSHWGIERILKSCPGPVQVVPLAYNILKFKTINRNKPNKYLNILTIGHVNDNKRVVSVIKAIASCRSLRAQALYRLVGYISPENKLKLTQLAKEQGVNLVISGEVDEMDLASAIQQADIISCLRWPVLEAASASTIEAMLYGKATIVTNIGFYSKIPDSCTIKINFENEIVEIKEALNLLRENRRHLKKMGQKAQKWASTVFTASNYSSKLVDMISLTAKTSALGQAIDFFNQWMHRWGAHRAELGKDHLIESLSIFKTISS